MLLQNNKIIDMHIHTFYSDGERSPLEIVNMAIEKNIGVFSITDHDTVLGAKKLVNFKSDEIKFIPGIEMTAEDKIGTMHILGYNIDVFNKHLNDQIIELKKRNIYKIRLLLEQIKKDYNIIFKDKDIENIMSQIGDIGRPQIAKLCVNYGYALTCQEAFEKYLIDSYEKIKPLTNSLNYEECIKTILTAGGIPILAHPYTLKRNKGDLIKLVKNMASKGLQGLEVFHSKHTNENIQEYMEIVNKFGLLYSGGSDYHGSNIKSTTELGTGINNNLMIRSLSVLSKMN